MVSQIECKEILDSDLVDSDAFALCASKLMRPDKNDAIDQEYERYPDPRAVAQYLDNL